MSQSDFDSACLDVITEFGGAGTYNKVYTVGYNISTGTVDVVTSSIPIKVALLDLHRNSNGLSLKYGTEILAGDKEAYILPPIKSGGPAIVVDPVNDKVQVNGVLYSVVTFQEVNPSGVDPILYMFYLRR